MPRMTKAIRTAIAEKVYNASNIPERIKRIRKDIAADIRELYVQSLPPMFLEATQHLPDDWFPATSRGTIYRYRLRSKIITPDNLKTISEILDGAATFDTPLRYPSHHYFKVDQQVIELIDTKYGKALATLAEDKRTLENSTSSLLASFRTTEALIKAAPEMAQFIPKDSVLYPVPAIPITNILNNFAHLGIQLSAA